MTETPQEPPPTDAKPPPIVVGVQGFDGLRRQGEATVNWDKLCRLPTFQMFIEERDPNTMGIPSDAFAAQRAQAMCAAAGSADALIADYEAWHADKGFWPHETPYGVPR